MKKEDFDLYRLGGYGSQRTLERDRVKSGRDLIRVTKLTRAKLDELRNQVRSASGYDELLYLLVVAALRDLELERVNPALENRVNLGDPPGKPARGSYAGKPGDRQVNPTAGRRRK